MCSERSQGPRSEARARYEIISPQHTGRLGQSDGRFRSTGRRKKMKLNPQHRSNTYAKNNPQANLAVYLHYPRHLLCCECIRSAASTYVSDASSGYQHTSRSLKLEHHIGISGAEEKLLPLGSSNETICKALVRAPALLSLPHKAVAVVRHGVVHFVSNKLQGARQDKTRVDKRTRVGSEGTSTEGAATFVDKYLAAKQLC